MLQPFVVFPCLIRSTCVGLWLTNQINRTPETCIFLLANGPPTNSIDQWENWHPGTRKSGDKSWSITQIYCPPMRSSQRLWSKDKPDEGPSSASTWTSIGGVTLNPTLTHRTPEDEAAQDGRASPTGSRCKVGAQRIFIHNYSARKGSNNFYPISTNSSCTCMGKDYSVNWA